MDKKQVLSDYITYKKLTITSAKILDIQNYINQFITFSNKPLEEYTEKELIDFLNVCNSKYSKGTQNVIKVNTKNFIKWLWVDWSSRFRNLDKVCRSERPPSKYGAEDMLRQEEFEEMIKHEQSFFWKAYFLTLFYGGCRPVEVCNLKWKDVEFDNEGAFFSIFSNKNKKKFVKYVPEKVAFYLKSLQNNGSEYVFLNPQTKRPLTKKGAYWKIKALSKETLGKSIDLYTLRHSIATILYNKEGKKDDDIAKQMGHTKSMKNVYTHNDLDKIKSIAKSIYFEPEDLPQEKKHALEKVIETQGSLIKLLLKKEMGQISKDDFAREVVKLANETDPKAGFKVVA